MFVRVDEKRLKILFNECYDDPIIFLQFECKDSDLCKANGNPRPNCAWLIIRERGVDDTGRGEI